MVKQFWDASNMPNKDHFKRTCHHFQPPRLRGYVSYPGGYLTRTDAAPCPLTIYQSFGSESHMSNGLNLLHPRKDVAEMVIVFCVSPIVPEVLVFVGMK